MKSAYRADIDGLRAIAIISVVLFHAGVKQVPSGFVGVDIFFVISGYLIGGIIFHEIHSNEFSFSKFYARRAKRILPALIFIVSVSCIFGSLLLNNNEFLELTSSSSAAILGISNIKFFLRNDYFNNDSSLLPMLMTWSLGVEEQFYLFFPLLLLSLKNFDRRRTEIVLATISIGSFLLSVVLTKIYPAAAFYLLPMRAWELSSGSMLAIYHQKDMGKTPAQKFHSKLLGTTGLLAILLAAILFDKNTLFPGIPALLPVAGTLMLLHSRESFANQKLLSARPIVFIGLISYSWYLWHWPLMAFVRIISIDTPSTSTMVIIAAISFIIAYFSWRWIEQPFRKKQQTAQKTLTRYAVALLLVFSITFGLKINHGWPSRIPNTVIAIEDAIAKGKGECMASFGTTKAEFNAKCDQNQGPSQAIALLGDSHANSFAPSLQEVAKKLNMRLIQITKVSCAPLLKVAAPYDGQPTHQNECGEFMYNSIQRIIGDSSIKIVIVGGYWGKIENKQFLVISGPDKGKHLDAISAYRIGLPPLLDSLTNAGKKLFWWEIFQYLNLNHPK